MKSVCFLLGIMPRSGTNFLENKLRLHPECIAPGPVWEDFIVCSLPRLNCFVRSVSHRWDQFWFRNTDINFKRKIKSYLGQGLTEFLLSQGENQPDVDYLLTKTPSVAGLAHYPDFFPEAKLVIIVRDGRALVESGRRSFDWDFVKAVYDWRINASAILAFQRQHPGKCLVVKYEDLVSDELAVIARLCDHLNIDYERYPVDAKDIPVSGSSELKQDSSAGLHWRPVDMGSEFNPLERHSQWGKLRKRVFACLANTQMKDLGYATEARVTLAEKVLVVCLLLAVWPVWVVAKTAYYLLKEKKFILKTF